MQFTLLIYGNPQGYAKLPEAESQKVLAAFGAYTAALKEANVYVGSNRLKPAATATTISVRDGSRQVQDGPFAETKEELGGYFLIEVPDLDAAITWAARCPAVNFGSVEVRPVWQM